jgi:hypothetical protein
MSIAHQQASAEAKPIPEDPEGRRLAPTSPRPVAPAFALLLVLLLGQTAHETLGWGGDRLDTLFDSWIHDLLMLAAAGLCMARGVAYRWERAAWLLIGSGLLAYALGDVVWAVFYSGEDPAPFPTISDAFWLAWFPLGFAGLALLVRLRIARFEIHQWIDGIAVALLIATPGVALVLEPIVAESEGGTLAKAITMAYPIGDIVMLGAAIGVFALTGWRPGRAWVLLAVGLALFVGVDSVYSVQTIEETYVEGVYDFIWPAGALLIAFGAWQEPRRHGEVRQYGWKAIALPMLCQVFAIAIQVYAFLYGMPEGERLLTVAVLVIVIVQVVVTRPRPGGERASPTPGAQA